MPRLDLCHSYDCHHHKGVAWAYLSDVQSARMWDYKWVVMLVSTTDTVWGELSERWLVRVLALT